MDSIVFTQLSATELRRLFRQEMADFFQQTSNQSTTPPSTLPELLTRREAADLAGVCLATIDNKVRDGVLKKYRTGGIVRFKRQEIIEAFSQSSMTKTHRRGASRTAAGKKP